MATNRHMSACGTSPMVTSSTNSKNGPTSMATHVSETFHTLAMEPGEHEIQLGRWYTLSNESWECIRPRRIRYRLSWTTSLGRRYPLSLHKHRRLTEPIQSSPDSETSLVVRSTCVSKRKKQEAGTRRKRLATLHFNKQRADQWDTVRSPAEPE